MMRSSLKAQIQWAWRFASTPIRPLVKCVRQIFTYDLRDELIQAHEKPGFMCRRVSRPVRFSREMFSRTALETRPHMINLQTDVKGLLTRKRSGAPTALGMDSCRQLPQIRPRSNLFACPRFFPPTPQWHVCTDRNRFSGKSRLHPNECQGTRSW